MIDVRKYDSNTIVFSHQNYIIFPSILFAPEHRDTTGYESLYFRYTRNNILGRRRERQCGWSTGPHCVDRYSFFYPQKNEVYLGLKDRQTCRQHEAISYWYNGEYLLLVTLVLHTTSTCFFFNHTHTKYQQYSNIYIYICIYIIL